MVLIYGLDMLGYKLIYKPYKHTMQPLPHLLILFLLTLSSSYPQQQSHSPPNITRQHTYWQWCPCGTGVQEVRMWPRGAEYKSVDLLGNSVKWVNFGP